MCRCHNPLTLHAVTTRGMLVPSNAITVASRRQDTTSGWHSDWSPTPPPSRPVNSKAFESIDRRWWKNRSSIKNTSICTYLASLRSKNDGHEKKERENGRLECRTKMQSGIFQNISEITQILSVYLSFVGIQKDFFCMNVIEDQISSSKLEISF